jgi:UPF0755 protein
MPELNRKPKLPFPPNPGETREQYMARLRQFVATRQANNGTENVKKMNSLTESSKKIQSEQTKQKKPQGKTSRKVAKKRAKQELELAVKNTNKRSDLLSRKRKDIRPIPIKKIKPLPKPTANTDFRNSVKIAADRVQLNFGIVPEPELNKTQRKIAKKRRKVEKREYRRQHRLRNWSLGVLGLVLITFGVGVFWWSNVNTPVNVADKNTYQFNVASGATTEQIGRSLQAAGFVRSSLAFQIYLRLNPMIIQAGTYLLSPWWSLPKTVDALKTTIDNSITVTVLPGKTLKELRDVWKKIGFTDAEIDAAYAAEYASPVFDGRPEGVGLEGYIYPDTYQIHPTSTLEEIIQTTLDEFASVVAQNDIGATFASRGLNLYQGITLSSIVELEDKRVDDQKMIAGVFFNRLNAGMSLGSDPTWRYAYANGLCADNSPSCDSSYNTRIVGDLPPGPIANVNEQALLATARPTDNDYLFFVSGDDGTNHFSLTEEEHNFNVATYCQNLCSI